MVLMEKIQLKAFDGRRNQNFWFHFCYIADEVWARYTAQYPSNNMDNQVKYWLKQDFDFDVTTMEDVYYAKDLIKKLYAEVYPDVYLPGVGDRQGWTRVWLTAKINKLLEEHHE